MGEEIRSDTLSHIKAPASGWLEAARPRLAVLKTSPTAPDTPLGREDAPPRETMAFLPEPSGGPRSDQRPPAPPGRRCVSLATSCAGRPAGNARNASLPLARRACSLIGAELGVVSG
ncbi:unnamed protein product [Gadus morhua 'NCC']